MKNRGFTLIELLVVISIISLLSTVVMASLNQSRAKAQEATIKQTLQSIKTQAELEYSKTGDYSNVATAIAPMIDHINKNGGTATTTFSNISPINEGYKRYAVSAKLNSDPLKSWSISDSGNVAKWDTQDTNPDGNTVLVGAFMKWSDAIAACKLFGGRLPTVEELISLRNAHGTTPSGMQSVFYWSSTTYAGNSDYAWVVDMSLGNVDFGIKDYGYSLVRCVH
jgi:prepilin-type N-terminal cleavage/methylation domain-containing protein